MISRIRDTYQEFPQTFWILVVAQFIDRLGATLIMPFFSLYITQKFGVGMTQAGILFGIFSISGLIGSFIGGALTDRFGRRKLVLFGLVISALSSVSMGLVNDLRAFYLLAGVVGILSDVAGPAYQAMIADILVEEKRAEGFGVLRVAGNMAWIIGPTIGGLLASQSYLLLFILDAISSIITAIIVYRMIPETKPEVSEEEERGTLLDTMKGYVQVANDRLYLMFVLASILVTTTYLQLYSTLSVFLRDVHGVSPQTFGSLMSLNALTVVIFQFWLTRRIKRFPQLVMMAAGTVLYMVGFTMYGFVLTYAGFLAAMLIITVGEMIIIPTSQALAARFAPADMRGRYMAFFGLSWAIPSTFGATAAGLIMDNYDPRWVWYSAGIIAALAAIGFLTLQARTQERFAEEPTEEAQVVVAS
ncbi:MAG: MFS transporter [Anaerolineales bacterium]|nr:MFS transporter [Anaerolineales bacterium]